MTSNTVRDPRRWWILIVLCLSVLVLMIDNTVLNLAIPALITDLGATPSHIQWILDAYVLAFAGLLLTTGTLSDRYGRRLMLVIGLVVFGAASGVAMLSTEPWHLIASRGLMGVGGAIVMPSTLSILMTVFDEEERRKAMSMWMTTSILAIVLGPTLGGFLLQNFGWSSVFAINLPVVVIALVAAFVIMPESKGQADRKVDPVGVVLSILALGSTVFVIIERKWEVLPIGIAVLAVVAFILWEAKSDHPMLPTAVFRSRAFSGACFTMLMMMFGIGAVMMLLTQYLQFVLGYQPMQAGLAMLPYAIAATVFNGLGATLGKKLSNKVLIVSGLIVIAGAFVILAYSDGYAMVLASMLVMGVGGGLAGPAAYASIMSAIPLEHAGVGSAMNDTLQQVGMAISIAVLGSALAGVFTSNMPEGLPALARESIGEAFKAGYVDQAKEAFSVAMSTGAWIGAGFTLAAAALGLVILKAQAPKPAAEEVPVA